MKRLGTRTRWALARVTVLIGVATSLVALSARAAVRVDATIRATATAGEQILAAIRAFERDHHRSIQSLSELVPQYLGQLPAAYYGEGQWQLVHWDARFDERTAVSLTAPGVSATVEDPYPGTLGVQVPGAPQGDLLARYPDGCWRLPALGHCWRANQ